MQTECALNLNPLKAARLWPRSTEARLLRMPEPCFLALLIGRLQ
jgi:hypothetical protein